MIPLRGGISKRLAASIVSTNGSHCGLWTIADVVEGSVPGRVSASMTRTTLYPHRSHRFSFLSATTSSKPTTTAIRTVTTSATTDWPYCIPSSEHAAYFSTILDHEEGSVVTSSLEKYNTDWRKQYQGQSTVVLKPRTTRQVSEILKYCVSRSLPIVPQGGNTGLVGGSVSVKQEVVLSLERLNHIYPIDVVSGLVYCQAGCILEDVQNHAAVSGLLIPLDLGSKGTCQVGGNISTNAGGHYYYRYGSLAANLVGAQVVLANGDVLNLNFHVFEDDDENNETKNGVVRVHSNLKDNTGYKLHPLFLGAEGTLGIVTAVALKCPPLPRSTQAAFVACPSFEAVVRLISLAKQELGELLAALEWMDPAVLQVISNKGIPIPIAKTTNHHSDGSASCYPQAVLLETHGSSPHIEKLHAFLEQAMAESLVTDGVVAQDMTQVADFWRVRESANPSVAALGYGYKYDLSLPVAQFDSFLHIIREHTSKQRQKQQHLPELLCANWGHVLDGNLHLNFATPGDHAWNPAVVDCLEPFVFDQIHSLGGSISAEHGIGQSKRHALLRVHDLAVLAAMKALKHALDPKGILNPYKVLP